ncbi:DUF898 family protein [Pseudovibrio sp. Tun.PSC04-5.I4]|uniref:DUF898 family protein n=1 Tax=Pseudovibrio sp. Tun.PSC04-5.I4 TaxID=1798213 RepID=UPI0013564220|nr:DUF898 family protein [Pseudovibrio sp. Tun.PSC04-5.I4]
METTNQVSSSNVTFVHVRGKTLLSPILKWVLLTMVTLGIYRFWAMTGLRRALWSAIKVGGDQLRYHGTGRELFIGFLIAMTIVVPFYAAIYFLQFMGPKAVYLGSGLSLLGLIVITPYAIFRRRRYILTRTSWRGIRFNLQGSPWKFVRHWIFWTFVSVISFGLALPARYEKLDRILFENSSYGNKELSYTAEAKDYFLVLLPAYVAVFVLLIAFVTLLSKFWFSLFLAFGAAVVIWPFIQARIFRLRTNSIFIGDVTMRSNISSAKFYTAYGIYIVFLLVGFAVTFMAVQFYLDYMSALIPGSVFPQGLGVFGYVIFIPIYGLLLFANMMVLQVMLFEWKMGSLMIFNTDTLHNAIASGELENPVGMGLADALDAGFELV